MIADDQSHADTIRREMTEREYQWLRPTPIGQNIIDLYATVAAERDALLAENQRLAQRLEFAEREAISKMAENQRLRDLLQRLSEWDALNIDPPEWPWGDWPHRWKAEVDEALAGGAE